MFLPAAIRTGIELLEPIVRSWPVSVEFDEVVRWVLQFEPDDFDIAIRTIRNLNVLGTDEIRKGLQIAYARLLRRARDRETRIEMKNTIFAAIGDAGKSGGMVAYEFRIANGLPESNFSSESRADYLEAGMVENVVLVDDVIGTGRSAIEAASKVREEATPLGVKNVFVLAACGFEDALERVRKESGADTFAAFTFGINDTVTSFDSNFYAGLAHHEKERLLERLKYYNVRASRNELGYGAVGALIAFRHNSPNVTLPIVWSDGNGWNPLFPRLGRIAGIHHFYAQVRRAQENVASKHVQAEEKGASATLASTPAREVTLLVEGKADEMVLDSLIRDYKFEAELNVDRISTVSLGGVYASPRLLELIKASGGRFIRVLDDDPDRVGASNQEDAAIPTVKIKPSIVGLLQFERLSAWVRGSEEQNATIPSDDAWRELERRLRGVGFGRSPDVTSYIIDRFRDEESMAAFLRGLQVAVRSLFDNVAEPKQ